LSNHSLDLYTHARARMHAPLLIVPSSHRRHSQAAVVFRVASGAIWRKMRAHRRERSVRTHMLGLSLAHTFFVSIAPQRDATLPCTAGARLTYVRTHTASTRWRLSATRMCVRAWRVYLFGYVRPVHKYLA